MVWIQPPLGLAVDQDFVEPPVVLEFELGGLGRDEIVILIIPIILDKLFLFLGQLTLLSSLVLLGSIF